MMKHRELLVGRRGEAPLVPPYILPCFERTLAVEIEHGHTRLVATSRHLSVGEVPSS